MFYKYKYNIFINIFILFIICSYVIFICYKFYLLFFIIIKNFMIEILKNKKQKKIIYFNSFLAN